MGFGDLILHCLNPKGGLLTTERQHWPRIWVLVSLHCLMVHAEGHGNKMGQIVDTLHGEHIFVSHGSKEHLIWCSQ